MLPRAGRLGRLRKDGGGVGLGIRAGGVLPAAVSRSLLAGTVEPARVALDLVHLQPYVALVAAA